MRKEIANFVMPIFRTALEYKEGLRFNEASFRGKFGECQKKILALLQAPVAEELRTDVLGEPVTTRGGFLGIRYALACWLDEVFILDSAWRDQWNVSSLESTLYRSRERATEFWQQAQRAQIRPTRDALEVFYLCVMLGFRGEMIDKPGELNAWRDAAQSQITQGDDREPPTPLGQEVTPTVQNRLIGANSMQRWFMIVAAVILAFIPLVIFLVRYWR